MRPVNALGDSRGKAGQGALYGFVAGLLLCFLTGGARAQRVTRAYIGADGLVHIVSPGHAEFVAPRETRLPPARMGGKDDLQASVTEPVIAGDHETVAWTVNFPNCCTSYPIPLTLVIARRGRIIQRFGDRPIFRFVFLRSGRQIAYYMDTLHGESGAECVLRDVQTGKLQDERRVNDGKPLPGWALAFRQELRPERKEPEP